jgi:hypothetical protein
MPTLMNTTLARCLYIMGTRKFDSNSLRIVDAGGFRGTFLVAAFVMRQYRLCSMQPKGFASDEHYDLPLIGEAPGSTPAQMALAKAGNKVVLEGAGPGRVEAVRSKAAPLQNLS